MDVLDSSIHDDKLKLELPELSLKQILSVHTVIKAKVAFAHDQWNREGPCTLTRANRVHAFNPIGQHCADLQQRIETVKHLCTVTALF